MKQIFVINHVTVKPGMVDQFLDMRRRFAMTRPKGLLANRTYRSADGNSLVFVSQFESLAAWELRQSPAFQENLQALQAYVETSEPGIYEELPG